MTLQEWMNTNELDDEALSKRLGRRVSRSQINRIRNGVSVPKIETARLLEGETGIPAAKFVMGEAA